MRHASTQPDRRNRAQANRKDRCGLEEEVPAGGARLRDGARGGGGIARGASSRNEEAGKIKLENSISAGRAGVGPNGSDTRGLKGAWERNFSLPRRWGNGGVAKGGR